MKRFFGKLAFCMLALAGMSAHAMPIGVRTLMQGRAAVRQTASMSVVTKQVWTVTFNANGGEGAMAVQTFTNGIAQVVDGNAFTRFGWEFAGWATSVDGEVVYADGERIAVSSGQTLYAQWREVVAGHLETSFAKAQTVLGALYGRDGVPVGTVQVKVGKANKKKRTVKIAATATLLADGKAKKVTAKAVNVKVAAISAAAPATVGTAAPHTAVTITFKAPIGEMALEMEADGTFRLKNGSYVVAEKKVGAVGPAQERGCMWTAVVGRPPCRRGRLRSCCRTASR